MRLRKLILVSLLLSMLAGCGDDFSSGDRVLVSKLAYDSSITTPKRYDVVVFKFPGHGGEKGPMDNNTPKNYIKRLLGLPGEIIAIFFGRLFHRAPTPGAPPFYDDVKDGKTLASDLRRPEFMHTDEDQKKLLNGEFKILRKPPHVMLALRRIVYDNDFQPKDFKELKNPAKYDRWSPAADSAWKTDGATGFTTTAKSDGPVDWIRYRNFARPRIGPLDGGYVPERMLILDTLDYNMLQIGGTADDLDRTTYLGAHWIGDLMLECNVEVKEMKGEFWLELSKSHDRFRAAFDFSTGICTLYREGADKKQVKLDSKPTKIKGPGNYLLRLANIDARLTVWVDRELPFGDGFDYDPPEVRGPNEKDLSDDQLEKRRGPTDNDLEPASLGVKGVAAAITHVRIWRDIYYRTHVGHRNDVDFAGDMNRDDWCEKSKGRWDHLRRLHSTTMYVQPGHYLCLGDNSQSSSDSRVWGTVPERLMLGRALTVYYPLERMGPIR
jgi:signal peptidase I